MCIPHPLCKIPHFLQRISNADCVQATVACNLAQCDYHVLTSQYLGYFIVSNVANIVAQIVAFFVNKEKTFNSGANVAVALPIYIVFTIALIFFSAWLNPTLKGVFVNFEWCDEVLAKNIATMICSAVQFFLYFPVDKILFHKKKEEKTEEVTAE